jgi:hypothetical protein
MNRKTFLRHLAFAFLIMPVWSIPGFCGQIQDADEIADLANLKAWLKKDPNRVLNKDSFAWTPLHFEARAGHKEAVKLLLVKGADAIANDGSTPLHVAMNSGFKRAKDVAELLRQHGGHE